MLLLLSAERCHSLKNITVGVFVPMTGWPVGNRLASAAPIAIDAINADPNILPGYKLKFEWRDCGCKSDVSAGGTVEFLKRNVSAIIGPYCSKGCITSGHIAAYYNLPLLTYSCSKKELSNKKIYPTVARTFTYARTNEKILLNNAAQLMKLYNWKIFTIIVEIDEVWQTVGEYFQKNVAQYGLTLHRVTFIPEKVNADTADGKAYRKSILESARVNSRSMFIILRLSLLFLLVSSLLLDLISLLPSFIFIFGGRFGVPGNMGAYEMYSGNKRTWPKLIENEGTSRNRDQVKSFLSIRSTGNISLKIILQNSRKQGNSLNATGEYGNPINDLYLSFSLSIFR